MQIGIVLLHICNTVKQRLIAEKFAVVDLFGNACQLLVYNSAGTHI